MESSSIKNIYPLFLNQSSSFAPSDLNFKDNSNIKNESKKKPITISNEENLVNNNCNNHRQDHFVIPQPNKNIIKLEIITKGQNVIENKNEKIIDKNTKELIQLKIKENIYSKKPFKEKKKLGRKFKSEECLGEHNKFSDDNLMRKIKNTVLSYTQNFINENIKILYSNIDKNVLKEMRLYKLKQKSSEKNRVDYNKKLLNRTLKSIFSEDVSNKYKLHSAQHNRDLIERLINDEDEIKQNHFNKLFNLTFSDCLNHFRGSIFLDELKGLKQFEHYLTELQTGNNNEMYKKVLKYYLVNYEKEIMEKKERKRKKVSNPQKD